MKSIKLKLTTALIGILFSLSFAGYGSAATLLPWLRYTGLYQMTEGIGTGSLTLNAVVNEMDYGNGDVWIANVDGVESIKGAKVVLSGATRTGDYSFNGAPDDPYDVSLSIVSLDGYVYYTAILADNILTQSGSFVWMNQGLDANNSATLNLQSIVLRPNGDDGLHPSRYLDELSSYMNGSSLGALKMQLFDSPPSSYTTNSTGTISYGLISGAIAPEPVSSILFLSGAATMGLRLHRKRKKQQV